MRKHYIMVVDDDSFTLDLYRMIIEWTTLKDYFRTEENALKSLDILDELNKKEPDKFPEYILLDLSMPEIHGFEFIERFQKKFPDRKGKTHFIITTSSVICADEEKAGEYQCVVDYLVKPIPRDYIGRLITEGYHAKLIRESY